VSQASIQTLTSRRVIRKTIVVGRVVSVVILALIALSIRMLLVASYVVALVISKPHAEGTQVVMMNPAVMKMKVTQHMSHSVSQMGTNPIVRMNGRHESRCMKIKENDQQLQAPDSTVPSILCKKKRAHSLCGGGRLLIRICMHCMQSMG